MYLSLQNVFNFVKCSTNSENAVEGEEVLRRKQIILCGKVQKVSFKYTFIVVQPIMQRNSIKYIFDACKMYILCMQNIYILCLQNVYFMLTKYIYVLCLQNNYFFCLMLNYHSFFFFLKTAGK